MIVPLIRVNVCQGIRNMYVCTPSGVRIFGVSECVRCDWVGGLEAIFCILVMLCNVWHRTVSK